MILSSWIEQNKQHSEYFSRWLEKAKDTKDNSIYDSLLQAAREMEKVNERLSQLLIELEQV